MSRTPGPWMRDQYGSVVGPDRKTCVAFRSLACLASGSTASVKEAEANTTLISAAPDLYAAAREIADFAGYPGRTEFGRMCAKLRAALDKADGK